MFILKLFFFFFLKKKKKIEKNDEIYKINSILSKMRIKNFYNF